MSYSYSSQSDNNVKALEKCGNIWCIKQQKMITTYHTEHVCYL